MGAVNSQQAISAINRQLKDRYPGPCGPWYWLMIDEDDEIVVRGWRLEINGYPTGDHLAVCRTVDEALIWIDGHSGRYRLSLRRVHPFTFTDTAFRIRQPGNLARHFQ